MKRNIITIFLLFAVFSVFGNKQKMSREEYVNKFSDLAVSEMIRTGIPASIKLAQACLESSNGNSMLAVKAKNHFGIKCHSSWKGKTIKKNDDKKNECFRVYKNDYESFKDHSEFLVSGQRYAFLFDLKPTDYKGWAKGLKKAGYATNPKYPQLLIKIIEDNKLYIYDDPKYLAKAGKLDKEDYSQNSDDDRVFDSEDVTVSDDIPILIEASDFSIDYPTRVVSKNNGVNYIVVKKGDTYWSLSREFELSEWQLKKFNDYEKDQILKADVVLYVQMKKNKAEKKYQSHTVRKGDNLHSISQLYAIKLKRLCKYNSLSADDTLKVGDKIQLRPEKGKFNLFNIF